MQVGWSLLSVIDISLSNGSLEILSLGYTIGLRIAAGVQNSYPLSFLRAWQR